MGNFVSLNQARGMATGSFVVNFAAQMYGMLTKPNMKDVADMNHYAFSPNPWFIAGFFSVQVVIQAMWIRELFAMREFADPTLVSPQDAELRTTTLAYAPIYALGNLCIAAWMLFWLRGDFGWSQVFVTINSFAQLAAITVLPGLRGVPHTATRANVLLHLVAKMFAGIGVLDFLDNGAVFLKYSTPNGVVQTLTAGLFIALGLVSDPIFGACLIYDLVGLSVGQSGRWARELGWFAGATGVAVIMKGLLSINTRRGTVGLP
ncbi:hypothetical protein DENSPDRAFT_859046 [Dentipellis sp. KUC8613]|nr:hypothetical protein DENSPDRAFT_859046 [Dentipellis sp. KUC8613]